MQFKKGMISVVLFLLVCVGLPAPLFHFFVYIYVSCFILHACTKLMDAGIKGWVVQNMYKVEKSAEVMLQGWAKRGFKYSIALQVIRMKNQLKKTLLDPHYLEQHHRVERASGVETKAQGNGSTWLSRITHFARSTRAIMTKFSEAVIFK